MEIVFESIKKELAVVMPVFNEENIIEKVLEKWVNALNYLSIDFQIHVYNDGSKDNTLEITEQLANKYSSIIVHDKKNSGHGPTILIGYQENCDAKWIFQVDSDDEMDPESFEILWNEKEKYDFLIGRRNGRNSPLARRIVSYISKIVVNIFYGYGVSDVNSPYRLMRNDIFRDIYNKIPLDTFAPNVIISGIACFKKCRVLEIPVAYRSRTTGEVSIKKTKLLKASIKSFIQTIKFYMKNIRYKYPQ
jgi:glycosyltransferase involved in cell wall biosynthesis